MKNLVNGDDLAQVYETSRLARKEPDVVMVNLYDKTLAWTDVGATVDVKGYLDDWGLRERVLPVALDEWTDGKGRLRAFPYFATNWPVAFNPPCSTRRASAPSPTTGDQLIGAARKLRGKGIAPVTVGGNDWTGQKLLAQIIQTFLTDGRGQARLRDRGLQRQPGRTTGHRLLRRAARRRGVRRQGAGARPPTR